MANTMLSALGELVGELEGNLSLCKADQLRARLDALDRLDVFGLDAPTVEAPEVYRRARAIQVKLEAANRKIYQTIRSDVCAGRGGESLSRWVNTLGGKRGEGYDALDDFLAGIFRFEEPGKTVIEPTPEMVFYQPTPARHIFDLLERLALTDEDILIDLGSGLGHVPFLTSICTSARSTGIELEPSYICGALRVAESLRLKRVTFLQQDAREANLREGTVFYLYTPFTGAILRTVLDSLRDEACRRAIRVCTLGPCTAIVAKEDWLAATGPTGEDRICIFRCER
jgi:hypothetical protein